MAEVTKTWECGVEGDNVIAQLKGRTLFISGNGRMVNFKYSGPWDNECITDIIIEKGVENIGDYAFSNFIGLKIIKIPDSVEDIGLKAFSGCIELESITIPESVRWLGDSVFYECDSLSKIINESIVPQRVWGKTFNSNYSPQLYVPASSIKLYRKTLWDNFQIFPIDDNSDNANIEQIEERIEQLERELTDLRFKKAILRGLKGNPKHVAEFMGLFNQRDGLKYLTHDIDGSEDFDYETVLDTVKTVCTENFEAMEIPRSLKELLNQFVFEENPKWTSFDRQYNEKDITSGWSSADWEEVKNSKLHPIKLPQFMDIIGSFKRLTRIESPYLESLVDKVFVDEEFGVTTKDLSKADFYTHVGEFKAALETIFSEIQKRGDTEDKKKVSIEYKREISDEFFVRKIIITHHNSYPTRNDKDALIREWLSFNKGSMAKIAEHLQGYCHWSVETSIDGEPLRVNILREKETEPFETIDNSEVNGFTHVLTFYYQS